MVLDNLPFDVMTDDEIIDLVDQIMSDPKSVENEKHPLELIPKALQIRIILISEENPIFFISLLRTASSDGYIRIKLYEKQEKIVKSVLNDHYMILLGSRQTGKTTVIQGFIVWLLTYFESYKAGILMQKEKSSKEFINETMKLYYSLPVWLKSELVIDNSLTKEFKNKSRLEGFAVDPKNPDAVGRGLRVDFLVIDEAAFIYKIDKAYTALKPATSRRHLRLKKAGKPYGTVIISTPNGTTGIGEWFYTQWLKAVAGKSNFKAFRFHWTEVPEYDEEWYQDATSDMSEREINQEYELKFLGSARAWLEDEIIEQIQNNSNIKEPISQVKLSVSNLQLFSELKNDTVYIIGADSADSGADYAAMIIIDYLTEEIVGCYYDNKVSITEFELDVATVLTVVPNSLLIFEKNSIGASTAQRLYQEFGANRIYVYKQEKRFKKDAYKYAGFATTAVTRKLMFSAIYNYVKDNPDKIICQNLIYELVSLEQKGTRIEAADNAHDDLVLTLGFVLYFLNYDKIEQYLSYFPNIKGNGVADETEVLQMLVNFNKDDVKRVTNTSTSSNFIFDQQQSLNSLEQTITQKVVQNIEQEKIKSDILSGIFGVT